jgi:hypothetical protein
MINDRVPPIPPSIPESKVPPGIPPVIPSPSVVIRKKSGILDFNSLPELPDQLKYNQGILKKVASLLPSSTCKVSSNRFSSTDTDEKILENLIPSFRDLELFKDKDKLIVLKLFKDKSIGWRRWLDSEIYASIIASLFFGNNEPPLLFSSPSYHQVVFTINRKGKIIMINAEIQHSWKRCGGFICFIPLAGWSALIAERIKSRFLVIPAMKPVLKNYLDDCAV